MLYDIHRIENLPSTATAMLSNVTSINRDSFMIVGCFVYQFKSSSLIMSGVYTVA